jgi:outer membrane protein OmpA-like peptidoglycan-associated protein
MLKPLTRLLTLALIPGLLAVTDTTASARPFVKKGSFELGLQMGGLFFLDEDAVPFDPSGTGFPFPLEHTFAYTLHGSYNFTRHWGLEAALQVAPAEVNRLTMLSVHLDAIWHPMSHSWFVPFFGVGPSFVASFPQEINGVSHAIDPDPAVNALAGVKLYPWEQVGFRVDLRYVLRIPTASDSEDGRSEVTGHDLLFSIGLFGAFGGEEKPQAPVILDTDGDGIIDEADACPNEPGQQSAKGCPDRDGDTLADAEDRCPDNAGPVNDRGCPDRDGDRIVDVDDRCPDEPGVPAFEGCADDDDDRIANIDDRCPKIPGVPEHGGCPPPPPEDVVKRYTGAIKGINFARNSDVIEKSSFKVLDDAVAVLKEYPATRLAIEGHTSAEGDRAYNIDLSQRRAASVKQYLVDNGIDATRIDTQGFGPDVPVAPNNTERNRAKNRRIEFKLLQP